MFESSDLGNLEAIEELETRAELGLLLEPVSKAYAARWDPRPDFKEEIDLGWIGEDRKGVWTTRHPSVSLTQFPRLWEQLDRFRYGDREINQDDYENLSAYELEVRTVLLVAESRAKARSIKEARKRA